MGLNMRWLEYLDRQGVFRENCRVADIGSSNLYAATPEAVTQFIRKWNPRMEPSEVDRIATKLAAGSAYIPGKGGTNEAFAGELFDAAAMGYLAFDVARGYKTEILDMNRSELPPQYLKSFDVVLNFGTTEHIFNQINSFGVIHDAATTGGFIFHQLPSVGFVDHCYFTYTSRFFFDLALANEYEMCDMSFDGAATKGDLYASLRSHAPFFPSLKKYCDETTTAVEPLVSAAIPDVVINVLFRKVYDRPFRVGLDATTSVGVIPDEVRRAYQRPLLTKLRSAYRSGDMFSAPRIGTFVAGAVKRAIGRLPGARRHR